MTPDDVKKLLGGYATGTLTDEEKQALFEAALQDDSLFQELADEEPLREMLEDPTARAALVSALTEPPKRSWWWRWMPAIGFATAAVFIGSVFVWQYPGLRSHPSQVDLAELRSGSAPQPPQSAATQPESALPSPMSTSPSAAVEAKKTLSADSVRDSRRESQPETRGQVTLAKSKASEPGSATPANTVSAPAVPPPPPGAPPASETAKQFASNATAPELEQLKDASKSYTISGFNANRTGEAPGRGSTSLSASATQDGAVLACTVLRRAQDGSYHAAPAMTVFNRGESIRLSLISNEDGIVAVEGEIDGTRQPLFTGRLSRNSPSLVPVELDAHASHLRLTFTPSADIVAVAADSAQLETSQTVAGVAADARPQMKAKRAAQRADQSRQGVTSVRAQTGIVAGGQVGGVTQSQQQSSAPAGAPSQAPGSPAQQLNAPATLQQQGLRPVTLSLTLNVQ